MAEVERHSYDVVVIGAGGAGLRAVIEARERGLKVAVVSKSLFGKAHTVMAEGGCAASMGNTNPKDNWQTHFGDTMRGGKFLNNWRMAELHAKEAPDRVWELETYGALFDRLKDGKISQRNFGGHTYPRLAHVGDRTGLELIRTMQQKIVSLQQEDHAELGDYDARIKVFAETTITELIKDGDAISGASVTEAKEHIIVLGSLSKTYAMTGWRAGFALGPKTIIAAMSKLQSQSTSNTTSMVQRAAIAALTESQECVGVMKADYIKLRDRVLEGFKTIPGLTCTVPQGAFYVYPNVSKFFGKGGIKTASDVAAKLLSEAHVVCVPGEPFGTAEHIRLSYAVSHDVVDEGVKRMREYFATLG